MLATIILAAVAAGTPTSLEQLAAALRASRAWRAEFVQTYTPQGFDHGTSEPGILTVVPPAKVRFDYTASGGRVFAVDGSISRLVDVGNGSCEAIRLDRGTWAKLPLAAVLDPAAAGRTFVIEAKDHTLRLVPREPTADLAEVTITLDDDRLPRAVLVQDTAGNRNRFSFTRWQTTSEPPAKLFAPSLPGSPPCLPED
ncbi:MAG: outer membrane lipoprotein carrier protein LolA [Thermoanaerobaculales bacterium]